MSEHSFPDLDLSKDTTAAVAILQVTFARYASWKRVLISTRCEDPSFETVVHETLPCMHFHEKTDRFQFTSKYSSESHSDKELKYHHSFTQSS